MLGPELQGINRKGPKDREPKVRAPLNKSGNLNKEHSQVTHTVGDKSGYVHVLPMHQNIPPGNPWGLRFVPGE